jgi:hypothetical protein
LVFGEEIFQEIPDKNEWNGTTRLAAYICDPAFEPTQGDSESYEPQESGDDGSVSAFAQPRAGKGRQRSEAVGQLKMWRRSIQLYDVLICPPELHRGLISEYTARLAVYDGINHCLTSSH